MLERTDSENKTQPRAESSDVLKDFSFYKLFQSSEKQFWKISDIPWGTIDKTATPKGLPTIIRELAYGELTTYSATKDFMEMFADDLDFTQWLSIWFFEETKHPLALMKWLSHFEDQFDSEFMRKGREIFPMRKDRVETLCMNIVSEVTAAQAYRAFSEMVTEPVLKQILHLLSIDETRHANGFYAYARNMIGKAENPDAAKLSALRVLFYCLYSTEQRHPVNEVMMRISVDLADSVVQVGTADPNVPKLILHKFSQLTGFQLTDQQDVIAKIRELREAVGEAT